MSPRRINQITVALLLVGFASALVIYFNPRPVALDPLGDQLASKKYLHELRVLGGNANVFFAEFQSWLASRWEGENLGVTVAFLTVVATLFFRFFAAHPELLLFDSDSTPPPPGSPPASGPKSGGPGAT